MNTTSPQHLACRLVKALFKLVVWGVVKTLLNFTFSTFFFFLTGVWPYCNIFCFNMFVFKKNDQQCDQIT